MKYLIVSHESNREIYLSDNIEDWLGLCEEGYCEIIDITNKKSCSVENNKSNWHDIDNMEN